MTNFVNDSLNDSVYLQLRIRLLHRSEIALGPGKVELLQAIAKTGSISKAAKSMNMSYRRAWQLVDTMNHCFASPLVLTQAGGSHGGGTVVTTAGHEVIRLFCEMEQAMLQIAGSYQSGLAKLLK